MSARCIRCGGEPMEQCLFCERCWTVVGLEAATEADHTPVTIYHSPYVRAAQERRLPAKVIWAK